MLFSVIRINSGHKYVYDVLQLSVACAHVWALCITSSKAMVGINRTTVSKHNHVTPRNAAGRWHWPPLHAERGVSYDNSIAKRGRGLAQKGVTSRCNLVGGLRSTKCLLVYMHIVCVFLTQFLLAIVFHRRLWWSRTGRSWTRGTKARYLRSRRWSRNWTWRCWGR